MSATTITRLKAGWEKGWRARSLAGKRYVYLWAARGCRAAGPVGRPLIALLRATLLLLVSLPMTWRILARLARPALAALVARLRAAPPAFRYPRRRPAPLRHRRRGIMKNRSRVLLAATLASALAVPVAAAQSGSAPQDEQKPAHCYGVNKCKGASATAAVRAIRARARTPARGRASSR